MDSLPWRCKPQDERQSAFAEFIPETPVSTSDQSISQASNDASQKLTRHSTPKVRTGCVTCKKRHVKCDETKPFCTNCLKLKGHCEGYVIKPRKKRAKPAPKSEDGAKQLTRQSSASTSPPTRLVDPDANVGFSDNLSIMYFDEFVYLVGLSLGGTSAYHNLWRATLPQLSRTNETLRHAAIAIGALSRAHSYDHGNILSIPRDRTAVMRLREESPHYHNAIVHYCRALRLQSQATSSASVAQTTVLLSILFICFEIIRGDRHSAIQHLNHGMTLLHAVLSSELGGPQLSSIAPNPKSLIADVIDTYTMLATQSRIVLDGQVGSSLPLPGLSKDLSDKGQTLDSFFLTMQAFGSQSTASIDSLPVAFTSLDEAESYWMGLQRWGLNLGMVYLDIMMKNSLWELEDDDEIDAVLESTLQQPQLHEITDQYMRMTNNWEVTFRPLFNRIIMDGEADRQTYIGAINLRLQFILTSTFSHIPRFGDHGAIEGLNPQFREMNSLCDLMLRTAQKDYTSPAHHVSLDGGVTWALGLIAVHCRDPLVREDAIRLLSEYPRRDGLWDTAAFRAVGVRNRALERANAAEGTPQEQWRRMWRREFIFEDAGSRVRFRFMEKDAETGKWRPVEEVGELSQGTDEVQWRRQPFLTGKGKFIAGNIMPMPPRPEPTDKAEPDTSQT